MKECTVDVTAAFEQQPPDSEMLAQQVRCFCKVNARLTGNDVGDAPVPQHAKIVFGRVFADNTYQVIAIQIAAGPPQLPTVSTEIA